MERVHAFVHQLFGLEKRLGLGIPEPQPLRHRVIIIITWTMFAGFALSLLATVGLAVAARDIPDVLPQILFTTLGYFGGAFASFMSFERST